MTELGQGGMTELGQGGMDQAQGTGMDQAQGTGMDQAPGSRLGSRTPVKARIQDSDQGSDPGLRSRVNQPQIQGQSASDPGSINPARRRPSVRPGEDRQSGQEKTENPGS